MKGEKLFCGEQNAYLKPPHSASLSSFIPAYQFIHPSIHPLTGPMLPHILTLPHPHVAKFQIPFSKNWTFYFACPSLFSSYPNYQTPSSHLPLLYLLLGKTDKSDCILTVFKGWVWVGVVRGAPCAWYTPCFHDNRQRIHKDFRGKWCWECGGHPKRG